MQCMARDCDDDFGVRLIAHRGALPCSLERLQFGGDGLTCNAFAFGSGLFATVSGECRDQADKGDDLSKWFHGCKCTVW